MAPKAGMSQDQKLEKILKWFYASATCHTLKDLETSIPTATKINKMQVKDLMKELTDTNQVKMEKIGSGNWYWAWADEQITEKSNILAKLEIEKNTTEACVKEMQARLVQLRERQHQSACDPEFQQLSDHLTSLECDVRTLTTEKDEWENAVAGGIEFKVMSTEVFKTEAIEATDNLSAMEDYLRTAMGISHEQLVGIREEHYGRLCTEGGEIPELNDS